MEQAQINSEKRSLAGAKRVLLLWLAITVIWGGALAFYGGDFWPLINGFDAFGTHDFVQYWSAFKLFAAGKDPYHPKLLLEIERSAGWRDPNVPLMMWNPPWLLLLMAPALAGNFLLSAQLWFALSLALLGCAWFLTESSYRLPRKTPSFLHFALCFIVFPLQETLFYGQSSVVLVLGLALTIYGLTRKAGTKLGDLSFGLGILCISVKPHLFFFFLALVAVVLYRERRLKTVFNTAAVFAGAAAVLTALSPSIWSWWLADPLSKVSQKEVVPPAVWKSATVVSILVYDYLPLDLNQLSFLRTAIPVGLALLYLFWIIRKRPLRFNQRTAARAITLSLLFAPYGWVMDQSILMIPQILLFQEIDQKYPPRRFILAILPFVALNVVYGWYCNTQIKFHHEMFWLPLAFFVLSEIYYRLVLGPGYNSPEHNGTVASGTAKIKRK